MPKPLKNLYTPQLIARLADEIRHSYPSFNAKAFQRTVLNEQWPQLELKQRMRHIAQSIHRHLPVPYAEQIRVLTEVAPRFTGFLALLFPDFVEVYGLEDPDVSIPALEHFTRYSSSEFAVRPFIISDPERMIQQHLEWSRHEDHHVRRLASEGIRPRLPWAMALPVFKKDPLPLLPILENLKNDDSEYVRRSVANNLNDISKDHPAVVLGVINSWKNISPQTDRIIKHASRSLLKQGHTEALNSFGLDHKVKANVPDLQISKQKLAIGDAFDFSFTVHLDERKAHELRIEYKVYFMKSNGKQAAKVFQVGTYRLEPSGAISIRRSHKFADLTTRRHYPGEHRLVVVVNGQEISEKAFMLTR
jgi:3-methyladenine DNA glycosylase AlkC